MANTYTKAQNNEDWLNKQTNHGTITFVNSGGSNDVAWSDTNPNSHLYGANKTGQTYAQGTIEPMGGYGQGGFTSESGAHTVYDGAQNYLGYIAGDGTPFVTTQPDNKTFVANTDLSGLTESQRQALLDASARLEATGQLTGGTVDQAVGEINASKSDGVMSRAEYEADKAYALSAEGGGKWINPNYEGGGESDPDPYAEALAAQKAALKRAYDQSRLELEAAKAQIPNDYYEAERSVTGASDREQLNLNEQFAALGLNTGARGQAAIAMSNVYQGNIGALEKQKMAELAEIEREKAALTIDYQNAIAEAVANNELAKAQQLYNNYLSRTSSSGGSTSKGMANSGAIYNDVMNGTTTQSSASQKLAQDQVDALIKAGAGSVPDSLINASGYSPEYVALMLKANSGGGGPVTDDSDIDWQLAQLFGTDAETSPEMSSFDSYYRDVENRLKYGDVNNAIDLAARYATRLSETQQNAITTLLRKYGV